MRRGLIAGGRLANLAEALLEGTIRKQRIEGHQLTIHADRGSPMASKPVAHRLADLGVTKSHSRPRCSNDNPYNEGQFRTLRYRPDFPARFGSFEDAYGFCGDFFGWYNNEHRHSGIAFHTPADVHHGRADTIRAHRAEVLDAAYADHPNASPDAPQEPVSEGLTRAEAEALASGCPCRPRWA